MEGIKVDVVGFGRWQLHSCKLLPQRFLEAFEIWFLG